MAQNGTSNRTGLPHGMVPFHHLADPQMRDTVMKLNENIVWLARRLLAAEEKLKNPERR